MQDEIPLAVSLALMNAIAELAEKMPPGQLSAGAASALASGLASVCALGPSMRWEGACSLAVRAADELAVNVPPLYPTLAWLEQGHEQGHRWRTSADLETGMGHEAIKTGTGTGTGTEVGTRTGTRQG